MKERLTVARLCPPRAIMLNRHPTHRRSTPKIER